MVVDKYEKMLKNFEYRYPYFYKDAVDWWASGRISIAIQLRDESILDYNDAENTIRWVKCKEESDDESKRMAFGCNLQKFILYSGMNKTEIAEKLGITQAMLSRYLHGKAIPSVEKAYQLAKLLGYSVEEFFDENYMNN